MIYIGIDPGKSGAIAAIEADGSPAWIYDTPTIRVGKTKKEIGVHEVATLMKAHVDGIFVTIEKQQAYPKQGGSSNFSTGRAFGQLEGIVAAFGIPHLIVHPRTWQKVMTAGIPGDDPKGRAMLAAARLFPSMADKLYGPRGGIKDGRADALLLAEYGRRATR